MTENDSPRKGEITAEMTVLDTVSAWKETQAIFQRYDALAGECICCNALFETIGDMAQKYGLNLGGLLADLEATAMKKRGH